MRVRAKVGIASQCAEDVANVVGGLDPLSERGVPPTKDAADNFDAGTVDVLDRWLEATLMGVEQVRGRSLARPRAIEVGGGAHDLHNACQHQSVRMQIGNDIQ